jgi:hypothetical protein
VAHPQLAFVDAVDLALLEAGFVFEVDARLGDHICHGFISLVSCLAPGAGWAAR